MMKWDEPMKRVIEIDTPIRWSVGSVFFIFCTSDRVRYQTSLHQSPSSQVHGISDHRIMKNARGSTSDIISKLPCNVIENILMRLPIQDAARTSILSSQWRYNWVKLPKLVFDDALCETSMANEQSVRNKLISTVYQVLLLHRGPILKFTLSISILESCFEIDQFINFVSRNGVKKFTLQIWKGELHKLPSSLFSCPQLSHLHLRSCVVKPPPTFKGFGELICLELYEVHITAKVLASLISSCPLLKRVILESSAIFDYLEIFAPNLKLLYIEAPLKSVHFVNAPLLETVSYFWREPINGEAFEEGGTSNMIKLFDSLPVIENMHVDYHYVKAAGRIQTTLNHLQVLQLRGITFEEPREVMDALCLIRNSPNLHTVLIGGCDYEDTDAVIAMDPVEEFYEELGNSDLSCNELRRVVLVFSTCSWAELEFMKFLLAKLPKLEKMLFKTTMVANNGLNILKEVLRFRRMSPMAEVLYLGDGVDEDEDYHME